MALTLNPRAAWEVRSPRARRAVRRVGRGRGQVARGRRQLVRHDGHLISSGVVALQGEGHVEHAARRRRRTG